MRTLPFLSITSPVSNIPHLTNADIDKHMPLDSNFGYYTTHGSLSKFKSSLKEQYLSLY